MPSIVILGRQEPGLGFTGPGSSRSACCNRQDEQCQPRLHSVPPRLHVHCASILHATPRDDLPLLVAQLPDVRAMPLCIEWLLVHRAAPPVCRSDDTDVTIGMRTEARRVGKECVSTWRSRGWPDN